jgi:hypothetical protein
MSDGGLCHWRFWSASLSLGHLQLVNCVSASSCSQFYKFFVTISDSCELLCAFVRVCTRPSDTVRSMAVVTSIHPVIQQRTMYLISWYYSRCVYPVHIHRLHNAPSPIQCRIHLFPAFFLDRSTLEYRTERSSRNVGNYQPTLHNIPGERRSQLCNSYVLNLGRTRYVFPIHAN